MIRPVRVKTLEEIKREYPFFNEEYPLKEIGYTPDKLELLGKTITEWNPDTIPSSTWIRVFGTWIKRDMILFTDGNTVGSTPKESPFEEIKKLNLDFVKKVNLFEKNLEPKNSTVLFHNNLKITITIEEI